MVERYRGHLIFAKAYLDRNSGVWTTSLHVQFNEDYQTFRDVWLPSPIGRFMGKRSAEKHALEEAKQWVDGRLLKANIVNGLDMGARKTYVRSRGTPRLG